MQRGVGDFVRASFPEPHNPIYLVSPNWDPSAAEGIGDFVPAYFPEPHNPVAPGMGSIGCGGGCGCDSCSGGLGAVPVPSWAASLPAPLNEAWGPLPVVYWGGVGIAAALILPRLLGGSRGGRRR